MLWTYAFIMFTDHKDTHTSFNTFISTHSHTSTHTWLVKHSQQIQYKSQAYEQYRIQQTLCMQTTVDGYWVTDVLEKTLPTAK